MNTQKTNKWIYAVVVTAVCSATSMNAFLGEAFYRKWDNQSTPHHSTTAQPQTQNTSSAVSSARPAVMWNGATSGRVMTATGTPTSPWKWMAGGTAAASAVWAVKKMVTRGR